MRGTSGAGRLLMAAAIILAVFDPDGTAGAAPAPASVRGPVSRHDSWCCHGRDVSPTLRQLRQHSTLSVHNRMQSELLKLVL